MKILSGQGHPICLELVGEQDTALLRQSLASLGIAALGSLPSASPTVSLARILQTWDLFVIPSHQEGLCIAALEAMACGVPVVSTRCGGPEEYVLSNLTGQLTGSDPSELAAAICRICDNRDRRHQLSDGALSWVRTHAVTRSFQWHLQTPSAGSFSFEYPLNVRHRWPARPITSYFPQACRSTTCPPWTG